MAPDLFGGACLENPPERIPPPLLLGIFIIITRKLEWKVLDFYFTKLGFADMSGCDVSDELRLCPRLGRLKRRLGLF